MRGQDIRLIEHLSLVCQSQVSVCVADIDEQDHDRKRIERAEICQEREDATSVSIHGDLRRAYRRGREWVGSWTKQRPAPGGEQAFDGAVSVPLLGGVSRVGAWSQCAMKRRGGLTRIDFMT